MFPDGTKYEGQFVNGKMDGRGVMTYNNGDVYDGMFKNNLKHGEGEHFKVDTNNFEGREYR